MEEINGHALAQFPKIPPFPDNVPTAPLLRISLQKLLESDSSEIDRLWKACTELGFFYLDLQPLQTGDNTSTIETKEKIDGLAFETTAQSIFDVAHEFYDLPLEEKVKYDFADQGSYHGYKGHGSGYIDAKGTKDRNEFYNLAKDDILGLSTTPWPTPPSIKNWMGPLSSFATQSHTIVTLLLQHLNTKLHLPEGTLQNLHRLKSGTDDQIRLVRSPPQPIDDRRAALGAHTDFGSVTLLFNRLGGLQILPPSIPRDQAEDASVWLYVRPLPGHCIVNLGDAMVKFTRGILKSNVHRVVNPPGLQGDSTRLSLVYFSRPENEVLLKPLEKSSVIGEMTQSEKEEEVVSAREWILRRALGRRGYGDWSKADGTEGFQNNKQKEKQPENSYKGNASGDGVVGARQGQHAVAAN